MVAIVEVMSGGDDDDDEGGNKDGKDDDARGGVEDPDLLLRGKENDDDFDDDFDAIIVGAASNLKSNGNAKFARMAFGDALDAYEEAIGLLEKATTGAKKREEEDAKREEKEGKEKEEEAASDKKEEETPTAKRSEEEEQKRTVGTTKAPTKTELLLATLHANAGACLMKQEKFEECVGRCSKAIDLHPLYGKAYARRAQAYEKLDDVERALEDYERAVEIEEKVNEENEDERKRARKSAHREKVNLLKPKVDAKREETKKEMFKQLRSLGDMVLGNFGLSCDNFKAEKDENTGGYSLKFVQEKGGKTPTGINENNSNAASAAK
jgi:tetratricopeptide (TPR) repeat protein